MKIYIIGGGGIGSWTVPSMKLLNPKTEIVVVDGDKLEKKNLNRQLFSEGEVGKFKAEALASRYGCGFVNRYFSEGILPTERQDVLIACVDNDPARLSVLSECDRVRCLGLFAANETYSSEAFVYQSEWKSTRIDPRVYYPEMREGREGDPRAGLIGCTGAAQASNPQLVTANKMASALAESLFVLWALRAHKFSRSVIPNLPYLRRVTLSGMEQLKVGKL